MMIWCFLGWIFGGLISCSLMAVPPQIILGNPNAQKDIIVYSSLTCHACKIFHEQTLKPYLARNSEYRVLIRHYPIDQKAFPAAVSTTWMRDQGFSFYESIFLGQDEFNAATKGEDFLDHLASHKFSKNRGELKKFLGSDKEIKQSILEDIQQWGGLIQATPTIFVGPRHHDLSQMYKASGALSPDDFREFLKEGQS